MTIRCEYYTVLNRIFTGGNMKKILLLLFIFPVIFNLNCISPTKLSPGGRGVKLIMKEEAPDSARLIDDIECDQEESVTSAKNCMRNKTAELGGNLVVIDTVEVSYPDPSNRYMKVYTANGRAYRNK